jgi:hypothetical protein
MLMRRCVCVGAGPSQAQPRAPRAGGGGELRQPELPASLADPRTRWGPRKPSYVACASRRPSRIHTIHFVKHTHMQACTHTHTYTHTHTQTHSLSFFLSVYRT